MDDSEMDFCLPEESRYCQESTLESIITDIDERYDFSHLKRGKAVIIINTQDHRRQIRDGWKKDMKGFEDIFSHFGFEVLIFLNKTRNELFTILKNVAMADHSDYDCFALAISSHGDKSVHNRVQEDVILTTDYPVKTRDILEIFTAKFCPSLAGKPKLVFVQACRGQQLDDGLCIQTSTNDDMIDSIDPANSDRTDAVPGDDIYHHTLMHNHHSTQQSTFSINSASHERNMIETREGRLVAQEQYGLIEPVSCPAPCYEDFLLMYATPPGFYAFRRPSEGSWFVKCLAEVLLKSDGKRDLMRELTRVTGKVAYKYSRCSDFLFNNKKQMPVIYSMLSKDVYLAPKSN